MARMGIRNGIAWPFSFALGLSLTLSGLFVVPVSGAVRPPQARVAKQVDKAPVADLALRVETAEGAFVVFDAVTPEGDLHDGPDYLAYWHDAQAREVYVYDRPVRTPADVGRALIDLERDFAVDVDAITAGADWLPGARAQGERRSADGAIWLVATRNSVLQAMGFERRVPKEEDLPMTMSATAGCGECVPPSASTLPEGGLSWDAHRVQKTDGGIGPAFPDGVSAEVSPLEMVNRTLAAIACPPHFWWCNCCGSSCTACCGSPHPCCAARCADLLACTTDTCWDGLCLHFDNCSVYDDECTDAYCGSDGNCVIEPHCDDGNLCTEDQCLGGFCEYNWVTICPSDSDLCTIEGCDPATGACVSVEKDCDDQDLCTDDICFYGACFHPPKDCPPDGDPCTDDGCNPSTGACESVPVDCDDEDSCTTEECVGGTCEYTSLDCDDGSSCTSETCDPAAGCQYKWLCVDPPDNKCVESVCTSGGCGFVAIDCDHGDPLTADSCDAQVGCVHVDLCPPPSNACVRVIHSQGSCWEEPIDCNDGVACTTDTCDPILGCQNTPVCPPPGNACVAVTCGAAGCGETAITCDDGNDCTIDTCDVVAGCVTTWTCGEPSDPCLELACVAESCVEQPRSCDDGDPCTDDSCDSAGGGCVFSPTCDDGNPCTADQCDADGACGWEPVCDDGDPLTADYCTASLDGVSFACYTGPPQEGDCPDDQNTCTVCQCTGDVCDNVPAPEGASCNDGNACTELDHCESGVCVGRATSCEDNNPCTGGVCDPVTQACEYTNVSGTCDDGDRCTRNDRCESGMCTGTYDQECPPQTCPFIYTVSSAGFAEGAAHNGTERVAIPQGTGVVWLRVSYFSQEYPTYTGQVSGFDDRLTYEVRRPSGVLWSGAASVNDLHDEFANGDARPRDEPVDVSSMTLYGDSWIEFHATATNIGDSAFPSGVTFEIDCDLIDAPEWFVVHDPVFERVHCQPTSVPRCEQAAKMTHAVTVSVPSMLDGQTISVWLVDAVTNQSLVPGSASGTHQFLFDPKVDSPTEGAKTDADGGIYINGVLLPKGPTGGPLNPQYEFEFRIDGVKVETQPVALAPLLTNLSYAPDILTNPPATMDPYTDMHDIINSVDPQPDGYGQGEFFGLKFTFDLLDDVGWPPNFAFINDPDVTPWGGDGGIVGPGGRYVLGLDPKTDAAIAQAGTGKVVKWEGFTDNSAVRAAGFLEQGTSVFMGGGEAELAMPYSMGDGVGQTHRGVGPRYVAREGHYVNQLKVRSAVALNQWQIIQVPFEVKYVFDP